MFRRKLRTAKRTKSFKEIINDSVVWWSLGLLAIGFGAGFGAHPWLKSIAVQTNCGKMRNYPTGNWIQSQHSVTINDDNNTVMTTPIILTDRANGTWFEGLGKASNGNYPKIVPAPLTISPPIYPGKRVQLTEKHADLTTEQVATPTDRAYVATSSLNVSEDGCAMWGNFSSAPASGTVVFCWGGADLKGLCQEHREQAEAAAGHSNNQ